jgi:hypothetical protein
VESYIWPNAIQLCAYIFSSFLFDLDIVIEFLISKMRFFLGFALVSNMSICHFIVKVRVKHFFSP